MALVGFLGRCAGWFTFGCCGLNVFYEKVGYIARVDGGSMYPVLNPDRLGPNKPDYVFLRQVNGDFDGILRGDIVTTICPNNAKEIYIKRVVGLPGDIIQTKYRRKVLRVPEGHCWIEGDNHSLSIDSNDFGPVPLGLIQSKAIGVVLPFDRLRLLIHEVSDDHKTRVARCSPEGEASERGGVAEAAARPRDS